MVLKLIEIDNTVGRERTQKFGPGFSSLNLELGSKVVLGPVRPTIFFLYHYVGPHGQNLNY